MYKKIPLLLASLSSLIGFHTAFAQVGDLPPTNAGVVCTYLQNNLSLTSSDDKTNNEVTLLQEFLQLKGFLLVDPTGYFGNQTRSAVINFQRSEGISGSGYVGPLTRERIKGITCPNSSPSPNPNTPVISTSTSPVITNVPHGTYAWRSLRSNNKETPQDFGYAAPTLTCNAFTEGKTWYVGYQKPGTPGADFSGNLVAQCSKNSLVANVGIQGAYNYPVGFNTSINNLALSGQSLPTAPTFMWQVWSPMNGPTRVERTMYPLPTLPCNQASEGRTWYLGNDAEGKWVVAKCASKPIGSAPMLDTYLTHNYPIGSKTLLGSIDIAPNQAEVAASFPGVWVIWGGDRVGPKWAGATNWAQPTVACNNNSGQLAYNVNATWYLGGNSSNPVVAICSPTGVLTGPVPLTASTLNYTGTIPVSTSTPTTPPPSTPCIDFGATTPGACPNPNVDTRPNLSIVQPVLLNERKNYYQVDFQHPNRIVRAGTVYLYITGIIRPTYNFVTLPHGPNTPVSCRSYNNGNECNSISNFKPFEDSEWEWGMAVQRFDNVIPGTYTLYLAYYGQANTIVRVGDATVTP